MSCNVGSIRQVHARLVKEGYFISEYTLRKWVRLKRLPATYVGTKALISYAAVLKLVEGQPTPEADTAV